MSGPRTPSLFDTIPVSSDNQETYSDLGLFLGILEDIKDTPHLHQQSGRDFYNMLTDVSRSCIAGSAVLGKRTRKLEIANDIDIFIDDRMGTSEKIIKDFFTNSCVKEIIWPAYEARVLTKDENRAEFGREAMLLKTSNSAYDFNHDSYVLSTFRLRLGKFITLNFILLQNHQVSSSVIPDLIARPLSYLKTKGSRAPYNDIYINQILGNKIENEFVALEKTSTYILEYIDRNFDFQELKYVYDFGSRTYRSIYDLASELNDRLTSELTEIEATDFTDKIIGILARTKQDLLSQHQRFTEDYSDPDIVTIASDTRSEQRFTEIPRIYKLDSEQAMTGNSLERTSASFQALTSRVQKYQKKGFEIKDPGNVLMDLHFSLAAAALGTLMIPEYSNIERQAIFDSSPSARKKYLFLNRLKVLIKDNIDDLGMELATPETRKRDVDNVGRMLETL